MEDATGVGTRRARTPIPVTDGGTMYDQETTAPEAPVQARPDLDDSSLYANRELSWLDFNDRVLQLAEDESIPLLERAKFLAIWATNLDEFFMVRVAGLHDQVEAGIEGRGPDGLSAGETIDRVRSLTCAQSERV